MVRPERRSRADLRAAAAIVAAVALVLAAIWWNSSARATTFHPADGPAPQVTAAKAVPDALTQRWTASSPKTQRPLVIGATVVTGDGSAMAGLMAGTGEQRWSYARDSELCAVSYVFELAVAVYPDDRGCGQVSSVKAPTGRRGPTRTSYADKHVMVSSDGSAVLSYGPTRLELWRSDMVRMLSYGELDARIKPVHTAVGSGCALLSAAASDAAVGLLEACPGEKDLRLNLLKPAKEEDEPDSKKVPLPGLTPTSDARVLAVAGTTAAVYLPTPRPRVVVYDETGSEVSSTEVGAPAALAGADPAVTRAGDYITWWTGTALLVFDKKLGYRYTINGAGPVALLGPATMMAGKLLIPVASGLVVNNPADGVQERLIPLVHPAGQSAVLPAVSGSTVLEQRGEAIAAFGPPD